MRSDPHISDTGSDVTLRATIFDLGGTLVEQPIAVEHDNMDQSELRIIPYARFALRRLKQAYKIGLLTNTRQYTAHDVGCALGLLAIRTYFDAVVTSVDVGVRKPDLLMFTTILKILNVAPQESVMIGDDRTNDMRPATTLGMRTAHFVPVFNSSCCEADIHFSSFADLQQALATLRSDH